MSDKKVTYTISLKDLMSGTLDKISKSVDKVGSKLKGAMNPNVKPLANSIDGLNKKLNELTKKRNLSIDTKEIKKLNKEIEETQKHVNKLSGNKTGGMFSGLGGMFAGLAIGAGAYQIGKDIFNITAEREKQRAVLTTALGSKDSASMAMANIVNFASKTPFQVGELTDAFIKLTNQGFKPSMKQMTMLGDLASSTGKNFNQLAEALLDARMGEFERLKEFGIKAKVTGDKIAFTFKGVTTVVDKSAESIDKYIVGLGELKGVAGSMAAISETLSGRVSNLSDNWDNLMATIGGSNEGILKDATQYLTDMTGRLNDLWKSQQQWKNQAKAGYSTNIVTGMQDFLKEQYSLGKEKYASISMAQTLASKKINSEIKLLEGTYSRLEASKQTGIVNPNLINQIGYLFTGEAGKVTTDIAKKRIQGKLTSLYELQKNGVGFDALSYWNQLGEKKTEGKIKPQPKSKTGLDINTVKGNNPTNINITINKLVETLEFQSTTVNEGTSQIREAISKVLVEAVNDINVMSR